MNVPISRTTCGRCIATRAARNLPSRVPTIMFGASVLDRVSAASSANHGGSGVVCSTAYASIWGSAISMSVIRSTLTAPATRSRAP